jgi:hypothetical protein
MRSRRQDDQEQNLDDQDWRYEEGYFDGLERAANIVVIKARGLKTGVGDRVPSQKGCVLRPRRRP